MKLACHLDSSGSKNTLFWEFCFVLSCLLFWRWAEGGGGGEGGGKVPGECQENLRKALKGAGKKKMWVLSSSSFQIISPFLSLGAIPHL